MNIVDQLTTDAKAKSSVATLTGGSSRQEISGHEVFCRITPVNTNGRTMMQTRFYIDGKPASKNKVLEIK